MDEPTRRAWSSPELIVLVRSGPEEAVLLGCKNATTQTEYAFANSGCYIAVPCTSVCSTFESTRPLALGNP